MDLPKKITPDNIKDAIVEVKYESDTPFELLIGIFAEAFDTTWYYSSRPVSGNNQVPIFTTGIGQEFTVRVGKESFLYNDKITIRLLPQSLVILFVVQPVYLGWEIYEKEVARALKIISETGKIRQWVWVGLRYISHYQQLDLRECIRFNFSFGMPDIKSDAVAFRSDFAYKEARVILQLSSLVPVLNSASGGPQQVVPTSIIDIDVIVEHLKINMLEDLLKVISDNHTKEKELYFGMISDEYLSTLKPEY